MPTWQKSFPKHKPFKCGAYWHLRHSGLWLAIYDLIGGLTNGGELPFFSSIQRVATYFEADYETVRRVFAKMRRHGWLERRADGHLYYIPHDVRAKKYPDECCKRDLVSWQNDTDPLVGKLFAIAGGRLHLYENHVKAIRFVATDEEFVAAYQKEFTEAKLRRESGNYEGTSPTKCLWRVYGRFKQRKQPAEVGSLR